MTILPVLTQSEHLISGPATTALAAQQVAASSRKRSRCVNSNDEIDAEETMKAPSHAFRSELLFDAVATDVSFPTIAWDWNDDDEEEEEANFSKSSTSKSLSYRPDEALCRPTKRARTGMIRSMGVFNNLSALAGDTVALDIVASTKFLCEDHETSLEPIVSTTAAVKQHGLRRLVPHFLMQPHIMKINNNKTRAHPGVGA